MFFLFSLMAAGTAGFAQSGDGFALGTSAGNVDCYYNLTTCNGRTVVLLRFDNKNNAPVTILWNEAFTTKQVSKSLPGIRNKQVTLAPGISEATNCEDANHKEYIIGETDVSQTYRAEITGFKFREVSVKPAN